MVYYCTTEYSSEFLVSFHAHNSPVYTIMWNTYITTIFITCAAEWVIKVFHHLSNKGQKSVSCFKVWDICSTSPLFIFDLLGPVGDVSWAPYSSTVFAGAISNWKPWCSRIFLWQNQFSFRVNKIWYISNNFCNHLKEHILAKLMLY